MAATDVQLVTAEQLAAMGDIGPCELIEGRIVAMAPAGDEHGAVEMTLGGFVWSFVRAHDLGQVYVGEVGVIIRRDPDTVRGADLAFIARERVRPYTGKFLGVVPDLVAEVVSPGDTWTEITDKLREYLAAGVRLVWVVHPERRTVYVYRALTDLRVFGMGDQVPGDDVLPGFSLPVADVFGE